MIDKLTVTAVIVAAGTSARMGFDKLMHKINGVTVLQMSVVAFDNCDVIDEIVIVSSGNNAEFAGKISAKCAKPCTVVSGGAQRANSVLNGVKAAKSALVAIHDAARPFVTHSVIESALKTAVKTRACAPAVPVKDTIKITDEGGNVEKTPERSTLFAVQTPQCFYTEEYIETAEELLKNSNGGESVAKAITDDCSLYEAANKNVRLIKGDYANIKITTIEDLPNNDDKAVQNMRIGHGYDVHKLVLGRKLILGGVTIEHETGLLGHSDADVLAHAVADALLGAAALGDIGKHFPDTKNEYKNADSIKLLGEVRNILSDNGYSVCNIDATVVCQAPKLAPHIEKMRENLAAALKTDVGNVSVKATTEEGLGFTGEKEGIAAHCVCLIS